MSPCWTKGGASNRKEKKKKKGGKKKKPVLFLRQLIEKANCHTRLFKRAANADSYPGKHAVGPFM